MSLHLVRLPIGLRALVTFAVTNGVSDDDGGYALHLALRRRFGEAGPQPFRFFADHRAGAHLLGYVADGHGFEDAAALPAADPLLSAIFDRPQVQPMPATWRQGARYGFEVRARPVVRYGKSIRAARSARDDAWQRRAGEVDAFVAACERAGKDGRVDREQVYREWLVRQFDGAAALEAAELRLLRRARTRRALHHKEGAREPDEAGAEAPPDEGKRRTRATEGPDAVLAGTLTVADPDAFARILARGVGRHAAFGFGMLLLSPPRRAG